MVAKQQLQFSYLGIDIASNADIENKVSRQVANTNKEQTVLKQLNGYTNISDKNLNQEYRRLHNISFYWRHPHRRQSMGLRKKRWSDRKTSKKKAVKLPQEPLTRGDLKSEQKVTFYRNTNIM